MTNPDKAVPASPPMVEEASMAEVVADAVSVADTTFVSADPVVVEDRGPLPARLSSPRGAVVLPRQEVAELLPIKDTK